MLPIIVLIGRKNVGKSSLFNVLTKTRDALVADHPGITRDRQYGYINIEKDKKSILIDTAGLDIALNTIEEKAYRQTITAIKECHLIFFVVSARDGILPQEYDIYNIIKIHQKKIILLINKIDGINEDSKINEFYNLGIKKICKVSASHNQGINTLISKYLIPWMNLEFQKEKTKTSKKDTSQIKIAFIGRPNVGKSTLINAILKEERMITSDIPGTTLDSISTPIKYNNQNYILIDTAGASKKKKTTNSFEKFSIIKTFQTIEKSNLILLIIDASIGICNQDLILANFIINSGRKIILLVNKSDLLNSLEKKILKNLIKNELKFLSFSRVQFISALYKKGILQIFKFINECYKISNVQFSTSKLTKIMYTAIKKHQPPVNQKYRIKLKYAHLGASDPLKIIIHGNQVKCLPLSYKRYLINFFYDSLQIKGTPIQIQFKNNKNPYILKKFKH